MLRSRRRTILVGALLAATAMMCLAAVFRARQGTPAAGIFAAPFAWSLQTSDAITATPIWDGRDRIYVRTTNSVLALNASDGSLVWQITSPGTTPLSHPPKVASDLLVVPELGSRISVYSVEDGSLRWQSPLIETALRFTLAENIETISVSQEIIYVTRFDGNISAYSLRNGLLLWEDELPGRTFPYVATDGDLVYLGVGPNIRAYDRLTGTLLWQNPIAGYIGPILYDAGILYVADEKQSTLLAFDPATRSIRWSKQYHFMDNFEFDCLTMKGSQLIIAAEELIVVSKQDGEVKWSSAKLGGLECPATLRDTIYVRNTRDTVFAFDADTGEIRGSRGIDFNYTPVKHQPNRGPVATDSLVILPIDDLHLVAYVSEE